MRSAQQRGTAKANIAKFSQIACETEQKLDRATTETPSSSRTTIADDIRRLNNATTASSKKSDNQNIARKWELRSVGRRGSAQDAIKFFNNKDSITAPLTDYHSSKIEKEEAKGEILPVQKDALRSQKTNANMEDCDNFDKSHWDMRVIGRRKGSARETIRMFNNIANENKGKLDKNPFSDTYTVPKYDTSAQDYGRPSRGSKTEARGIKAGDYVMREVLFLCEIINTHAEGEPPNRTIKFGPLFYIYAHYSDKLVGMLIRARKYKLVDFEGEMLYQRQDDDKIIRLLKPIDEIRKITPSGDPVNCIAVSDKNSE